MKKYLYLTIMMMPASLLVRGQGSGHDTLIKGSVIEVIQSYTPQVRQAPKPEWTPQIPPPDTFHRIFNYVVPQQPLFYTYHSDALKPLALGKDSVPPPLPDYVKAGVGNLSTLFLDAGIANLDKQNLETYIHLHHLSQKGNEQFQQSSLSGLEAEGMLYGDNSVLHMGLQAERNQYYYFGYDHSLFDYRNGDSLKQTYSSVLLSADLKRKDLGDSKFDYHPQVYGSYYGARANTGEAGVGVFLPMTYDFDSVYQIECIVSEDLAQLKTDSPGVTNNIFKVSPGFSMVKGDLSGHAYLGLATSNSGIFSVLPDIEGKIILPGTKFGLNGGWVSNLAQNTYQDLTRDNPYIYNNYQLAHTRTDQLFVGIKTDFGSMEVNGRVAWCNFKSLPVFLDTSGDRKQFSVKYDTVSAVLLQVGGKYIVSDRYSVGLSGQYYKYYQGSSLYAWGLPELVVKGDLAINAMKGLTVMGYLSLMSGIHVINEFNQATIAKSFADLGLNGEYNINSHIGVFLQVSNLLNEKYQRWEGYDSYGINIYGGARLKF